MDRASYTSFAAAAEVALGFEADRCLAYGTRIVLFQPRINLIRVKHMHARQGLEFLPIFEVLKTDHAARLLLQMSCLVNFLHRQAAISALEQPQSSVLACIWGA